jgi:hypothetical protein
MTDREERWKRIERMISEAKSSDIGPTYLAALESAVGHTVSRVYIPKYTVTIVPDPVFPEKGCDYWIDPAGDIEIEVGDHISFCNQARDWVTITFDKPRAFDVDEIKIKYGQCIILTAKHEEKKFEFRHDCNGAGGGGKFIIVNPPGGSS